MSVPPRSPIDGATVAINVLLSQAAWFACVLGAAQGLPSIGIAVGVPVIAWHLARAPRRRPELVLMLAAATTGALLDTGLVQSGWIRFESDQPFGGAAPCWMVTLWAVFATTLNVSLRWLRPQPVLAAVLGAIAGPSSYYAGVRLGAAALLSAKPALAAIGIGWAIATPLLCAAARRLDGYAANPSSPGSYAPSSRS